MIKFYTVDELFHKQDIDETFLASFNKLTESSQSIVKSKNLFLQKRLELKVINEELLANADNDVSLKHEEEVKLSNLETEDKIEAENTENSITHIDGDLSSISQPLAENTSIKAEYSESSSKDEIEANLSNNQILEKLESEYKLLNFSQEILHINNLYFVLLDKRVKNCPIHKKKLTKKKILIKVNGENKKITFYACQYCKRFYALNKGEDANKLKKANIPYKFIKLDDIV